MAEPGIASEMKDQLKLIYHLSDLDQAAGREYVRRMFIFDFPDRTKRSEATTTLRQGLKTAFKVYPHLTGRVGTHEDSMPDQGLAMLRYGDTEATREITQEVFQASYRKKSSDWYGYRELCQMNMPVSHWKPKDFCLAPQSWKKEDWVPAVTLKATFLGTGGLVLCFAFHQSLVDGRSISMFINTFAKEVQEHVNLTDPSGTYGWNIEDIQRRWAPDRFPEWNFDQSEPVYPYLSQSGRCRLIRFPATTIAMLQDRCQAFLLATCDADAEEEEDVFVSIIDVLSALMWVALLRARHTRFNSDEWNDVSVLTTVVDLRRRNLGGLIPPNYFGNMSMNLAVTTRDIEDIIKPETTTCSGKGPPMLASPKLTTLASCAAVIRDELHLIARENIEERLALFHALEQPLDAIDAGTRAVRSHKYGIKVASLATFDADVGFGIPGTPSKGGRPRFVRKPWVKDNGMIHIMPRRGGNKGDSEGDADWVVLVCADSPVLEQLCSKRELGQWADGFVDDEDPSLWWEKRFGGRRVPDENDSDDEDEDGDVEMQ